MILPLPLFCYTLSTPREPWKSGGYTNVGEGMGDIYIPSFTFSSLFVRPHEEDEGEEVKPYVSPSQRLKLETLLLRVMISGGGNRMQPGDHVGSKAEPAD